VKLTRAWWGKEHNHLSMSSPPESISGSRSEKMDERLATQVAGVRSPVTSGPTIVEIVALFCNPAASGTRSQSLQLRL
jgi:hypothetical protein